jgi:hypothetical protein
VLVNARDVKNVPGQPKTDKADAVWLAKVNVLTTRAYDATSTHLTQARVS